MTLRRRDGEQMLDRFSVVMPAGLSAMLGSVERCAGTAAAADRCPVSSRVGSLVAEVGAGPNPAPLGGDAYLTGPYRRAPFGLALVIRAVVGPFDLGTVVVRAALRVGERDGRVTVASDSLPSVLDGIPLRLQTIGLDIDRPGFMRNPTSCATKSVDATLRSSEEATSQTQSRFSLGGCRTLRFKPSVSMALTDRPQQRRGGHPGLRLALRAAPGGANLRGLDVRLPKLLELDPNGLTELCSREQARDGRCPEGSRVGSVRAKTPMLPTPLAGLVYAVQPHDDGLPDMWASLDGMGIHLALRGGISVEDGRMRTRFAELPDVPLSTFTLHLASGKRGALAAKSGLCAGGRARRMAALTAMRGQNDAYRTVRAPVTTRPRCRRTPSPRDRDQAATRARDE